MKKFSKLRAAARGQGYTIADMAKSLGKSVSSLNARFNGHQQWELGEMYAILDMLDIPPEELPLYFPPDGQSGNINMSPTLTPAQQRVLVEYDARPEMQAAIDTLLGIRRIAMFR